MHEALDRGVGVDELDHDRQIARELGELRGVHAGVAPEAQRAVQHGRSRETKFPRLVHDGFVQGLVREAVGFADEHSQQDAVVVDCHVVPRLNARQR